MRPGECRDAQGEAGRGARPTGGVPFEERSEPACSLRKGHRMLLEGVGSAEQALSAIHRGSQVTRDDFARVCDD